MSECAYVDGLVFRKNLAHKRMATELRQPRIMLLSGGIEFQRTESRITSLETLVDQEARYMQILVRLYRWWCLVRLAWVSKMRTGGGAPG